MRRQILEHKNGQRTGMDVSQNKKLQKSYE
jgi:hypothetical protein